MARWILPPDFEDSSDFSRLFRGKVVGVHNTPEARAVARVNTPDWQDTDSGRLYRQQIITRKVAYDTYEVEAPYGPRENATGNWTWDFDTTGGTVHITNSKETVGKFRQGSGEIPNHNGAIDVQGDEVRGVDITIPAMRLSVTYKHPLGELTLAQARLIHDITGMVNSTVMLGFPPGELLFLGGRGSDGTEAEATVSYQFAAQASLIGYSIGEIAGVTKAGWNVAWISYKDEKDETSEPPRIVKRPEYVYVERVYDTVDLAGILGFGR